MKRLLCACSVLALAATGCRPMPSEEKIQEARQVGADFIKALQEDNLPAARALLAEEQDEKARAQLEKFRELLGTATLELQAQDNSHRPEMLSHYHAITPDGQRKSLLFVFRHTARGLRLDRIDTTAVPPLRVRVAGANQ